jgi:hypothetical protein
MRISVSLTVAAATLMVGAAARAQQPIQPIDPYSDAAPAPPAAVAQPIDPYSQYPAPPAYGYQPPAAGPAQTPSPPSYQQGYYLYPAPGQPPVYYAPPPVAYRGCAPSCCGCCTGCGYGAPPTRLVRPMKKWDGARRFSIGAHVGFLTLNQQVGSEQVTLGGAGFQLRLRSAGRWGFEASQSFLHGSYWGGAWQRDAFPFALSLMFYIFPNSDAHHFNLYGLAGVGLVADSVQLYDENRQKVTQDFTEVEVHAGLGAELRFKWFGIEADARYMALWRDSGSAPGSYYGNVKGAPVQSSSEGVQGNLYLSLWF